MLNLPNNHLQDITLTLPSKLPKSQAPESYAIPSGFFYLIVWFENKYIIIWINYPILNRFI